MPTSSQWPLYSWAHCATGVMDDKGWLISTGEVISSIWLFSLLPWLMLSDGHYYGVQKKYSYFIPNPIIPAICLNPGPPYLWCSSPSSFGPLDQLARLFTTACMSIDFLTSDYFSYKNDWMTRSTTHSSTHLEHFLIPLSFRTTPMGGYIVATSIINLYPLTEISHL